nr:hypothetical protein [Tanacetum cinerariifolium]
MIITNNVASNEELKEPIEDQPIPADASPTALSPGYVVYSDPEKDEKDPKEDPAYYPADRGNNEDDESSNDDDDDDDVEKDEEDKEEEEHPAPADPPDVSTDDLELEAPIKDQPLPTDASPTALLPGYIDNSDPEEDEEDPVDYLANGGDNDDNESSDDDDDDDDVEKDEEDDEEEEHLALTDPSVISTNDHVPSS